MPSTPQDAVAGKGNSDTEAATNPQHPMDVYVMSNNGLSVAPFDGNVNGSTSHFLFQGSDWQKQLKDACSASPVLTLQTGDKK
jgi:hypothetical protein